MVRRLALVALASGLASPATAQQVLYDPLPPKGSAYLRVMNAGSAPLSVDGATLGTSKTDRVGPYRVMQNVAAGRTTVSLGGRSVPVTLAEASYTTLIVLPGGEVKTVTDETEFNQVRAKLTFYNAAAACPQASVSLGADGAKVFDAVKPGEGRMRAVNPVTAQLAARCGDEAPSLFDLSGLQAGARVSIVLTGGPQARSAFVIQDQTAPWKD